MKRIALALFATLPLLATPVEAREASTTLTCAAAKARVLQQGAILFDTSPTTFDRFVRDPSFCVRGEVTRPAWVPTKDNPQCMIGYTCAPSLPRTSVRF
jgi:hypothetical protein